MHCLGLKGANLAIVQLPLYRSRQVDHQLAHNFFLDVQPEPPAGQSFDRSHWPTSPWASITGRSIVGRRLVEIHGIDAYGWQDQTQSSLFLRWLLSRYRCWCARSPRHRMHCCPGQCSCGNGHRRHNPRTVLISSGWHIIAAVVVDPFIVYGAMQHHQIVFKLWIGADDQFTGLAPGHCEVEQAHLGAIAISTG
jgi:hypothetical protein